MANGKFIEWFEEARFDMFIVFKSIRQWMTIILEVEGKPEAITEQTTYWIHE